MRPAAPICTLNEDFVRAAKIEMAVGKKGWVLAHLAGFANSTQLSNTINTPGRALAVTALTRQRLERLADAVGYPAAEIFEQEVVA